MAAFLVEAILEAALLSMLPRRAWFVLLTAVIMFCLFAIFANWMGATTSN